MVSGEVCVGWYNTSDELVMLGTDMDVWCVCRGNKRRRCSGK